MVMVTVMVMVMMVMMVMVMVIDDDDDDSSVFVQTKQMPVISRDVCRWSRVLCAPPLLQSMHGLV